MHGNLVRSKNDFLNIQIKVVIEEETSVASASLMEVSYSELVTVPYCLSRNYLIASFGNGIVIVVNI